MKITNRRPDTQKIFGELKTGDVFRDKNDGDIMMKINPYGDDKGTNCISLRNGEGYSYDEGCNVIPITNVELIIG